MFAQSLMDRLFGPDPSFLEFLASITEFARIAEQAGRDLSLVKASKFSSQITGRFS